VTSIFPHAPHLQLSLSRTRMAFSSAVCVPWWICARRYEIPVQSPRDDTASKTINIIEIHYCAVFVVVVVVVIKSIKRPPAAGTINKTKKSLHAGQVQKKREGARRRKKASALCNLKNKYSGSLPVSRFNAF